MTEQVHHQTRKAADMDLSKKAISPDSHRAILEGRIGLDKARELGREAGPDTPPKPESSMSKDDTLSPCLCGCGELVPRRFRPGHDMRLVTYAKEYVRGERDLTSEQMEYVEESGKLERAKAQVEKEEAKREAKKQNADE